MLQSKGGLERPKLKLPRKDKVNSEPDLTPPTAKPPKTMAEFKGEKKEKKVKAEKPEKDPNAPPKPRAPRVDYGYSPDAIIVLVEGKDGDYRGHRKDWYETLKAFAGKKVSEWVAATKKEDGDPPRGWLRFFVQDGSVTLSAVPKEEAKAA